MKLKIAHHFSKFLKSLKFTGPFRAFGMWISSKYSAHLSKDPINHILTLKIFLTHTRRGSQYSPHTKSVHFESPIHNICNAKSSILFNENVKGFVCLTFFSHFSNEKICVQKFNPKTAVNRQFLQFKSSDFFTENDVGFCLLTDSFFRL